MAPNKKTFDAALIAEGRRLYEHTLVPVDDIAALFKIARGTLQNRINEWGWTKRGYDALIHPGRGRPERAAAATACLAAPGEATTAPATSETSTNPDALARRIERVIEHELAAIDRVLERLGAADELEAERSARTLSSLARALREVRALKPAERADRLCSFILCAARAVLADTSLAASISRMMEPPRSLTV